jgi:hypothetical protein
MIRIATCFLLTISNFYCKGQQTVNLTYRDKYKIIIDEARKYPEESKFADKYLKLTEMTITLADSLIAEMMRSYRDTSFLYLSNDPKTEKFFNGMKDMYSLAFQEIRDVKLKERTNERFLEVVASKNLKDWISKCFKGKSTIESLAALRELQTACLELTDLVFDQIMQKEQKIR